MWDKRYAQPGFLFGTNPADFLQRQITHLAPGSRVLCVADGEGRNSVWLAGQGHRVTAFDASNVGLQKAQKLAGKRHVTPAYYLSDVRDWDWSVTFDAVVAIFVQFAPPDLRDQMFGWMARAVAPGGVVLLHGYTPKQVALGTGGPPQVSHMYTTDLLRRAFADFEILHLQDYETDIDEGPGHSGRSALIDLVARKPG